jgi:hypothetical protein
MSETEKKKMPKGGAKGGTRFPRLDLKKAVEYAKKLVSKTHTGGQTKEIIFPGVFNTSHSGNGGVRLSALKQYGLSEEVEGLVKATEFAREIAASPDDELSPLLQRACLSPKVFHDIYETYQGDSINLSKIKQFAIKADVHLDTADDFTQVISQSLVYCGLAQLNGDEISIQSKESKIADGGEEAENLEGVDNLEAENDVPQEDTLSKMPAGSTQNKTIVKRTPASTVQVSINLDSTMDADKLDKMLRLLKSYGAI